MRLEKIFNDWGRPLNKNDRAYTESELSFINITILNGTVTVHIVC